MTEDVGAGPMGGIAQGGQPGEVPEVKKAAMTWRASWGREVNGRGFEGGGVMHGGVVIDGSKGIGMGLEWAEAACTGC